MNAIAQEIFGDLSKLAALRPTFAGMWIGKIRKLMADQVTNGDSHYTAHGVVSYFTDPADGQRYRVTVEPVKVAE